MRISTKGIYALEIVTDLAIHTCDGELESLRNIAKRRGLSEKYLERIMKALKQGGIVESVRGAYGGYHLLKDSSEITVRDVLQAVEGNLAPVECLIKETNCGIKCDACPTRGTWEQIWNQILEITQEVRIADIVAEVNKI